MCISIAGTEYVLTDAHSADAPPTESNMPHPPCDYLRMRQLFMAVIHALKSVPLEGLVHIVLITETEHVLTEIPYGCRFTPTPQFRFTITQERGSHSRWSSTHSFGTDSTHTDQGNRSLTYRVGYRSVHHRSQSRKGSVWTDSCQGLWKTPRYDEGKTLNAYYSHERAGPDDVL